MTMVGFSFTSLSAEKSKPVKGKINIANNVTIKNVSESKLAIDSKKQALKFNFLYTSKYEPDIGLIKLGGDVVFLTDEKHAKEALKSWKKDKKVPKEMMHGLMNQILVKCNIQAIIMSKDINLPSPIPLPKVK